MKSREFKSLYSFRSECRMNCLNCKWHEEKMKKVYDCNMVPYPYIEHYCTANTGPKFTVRADTFCDYWEEK